MKRTSLYFFFALLLSGPIFFVGCDDDEDDNEDAVSFDRQSMLRNYAEELIIPSMANLSEKLEALEQANEALIANTSSAALEEVKKAFLQTCTAWQQASPYAFGPAREALMAENLNSFPTNGERIEESISSGDYNLNSVSMLSAKGLPALDYLLYSEASSVAMLDEGEADRRAFVKALIADMKDRTNSVVSSWQSDGYVQSFVENDGTDAGSSLGLMVNYLNFSYERIKNLKLGVPLGKRSLGEKLPEKVELYYAGGSTDLINTALNATLDAFNGVSPNGNDGLGLDDHLRAVDNGSLAEQISEQIGVAIEANKSINGELKDAISQSAPEPETAYKEVQRALIFLKTDMPSALSVLITYQDNDGD